tara:strand:+ start:2497 stop:3711 length:1215 start_codon:yes stop_codon:yes gene_type:complete
MQDADKGQVIVPTGGGKTIIMIEHAKRLMDAAERPLTFVVVAPRILLANQLCDEFLAFPGVVRPDLVPAHVHSGETKHFSTTKIERIQMFDKMCASMSTHRIIFTTYHSLPKIIDSGISIDCAYFDEAHNSVGKSFFIGTAATSMVADRCYFFTATPRISRRHSRSMSNTDIYGGIICNVPAPELIEQGHILRPTIVPFETDVTERTKHNVHDVDADTVRDILDNLDETHASKVLVAVPSSRVLGNMVSRTTLLLDLKERGYNVMHVTSKFGAIIDGVKVSREVFFDTLTTWGKEDGRKFIVFHYSILSEGINVPGLTHCILLRNLNVVEMAQTIGRVIRLDKEDASRLRTGELTACEWGFYNKPTGFVTVPVHKTYGKHVVKRLQNVVDAIFVKGIPPLSLVA